uniref:LPXTG cell wall anchor domain-containing protein n=1 Tax=Enterococcus asini TaxID=57732 RepID=UPI0026DC1324
GTNERNSSSTASAIAPSSKQTPSSAKRYPQTNMELDQLFFTFLGSGLLAAAVFLGFSRKH